MKTSLQKKLLPIAFIIVIVLIIVLITLLIRSFQLSSILKTEPFEVTIANITPTSAEIYWKVKEDDFQILYFKTAESKENSISALSNTYAFTDNIKKANLYITQLSDLEPNQNYRFTILSTKTGKVWDFDYSFKTKDSEEKVDIALPSIAVGESNIDKLVLFTFEDGEKLITDTLDHGTWVIDDKEKKYTVEDYAQITPEEELVARLNKKLISSVYATDVLNPKIGANCQTNITIKASQTYGLTKGKFTGHPVEGWLASCLSAHYGNECYEDVFCSAVEEGVHPGFALTIWFQETNASTYEPYTIEGQPANGKNVKDFGIDDSDIFYDFSGQLDHLLTVIANPNYLKGSGNNDDIRWATKYVGLPGSEEERTLAGVQYYSKTVRNYGILGGTGELHFPFRITPIPNACDRTKQTTNLMYRDCNGNKTSACSGQDTIPGKLDILVGQTCTDVGGCECYKGTQHLKDVACGVKCTDTGTPPTPTEYTCWYFEPSDPSKTCKSTKGTSSCAKRGMYTSENSCKNDPLCYIKDGTRCTSTRSTQTCDEYHLRSWAFQDNKCTIRWKTENPNPTPPEPEDPEPEPTPPGPNPTPTPTPTPTPDPDVNCTGPDTIPGKLDILVGETCTDVGGCECFKGSMEPKNYLKDVPCGVVCTGTSPAPEPIDCSLEDKTPGKTDILIGENCEDTGGCRCFYNSKEEENYLKDVACDEICADKSQICCLVDDKLSVKKTSECEGAIMEEIPTNSCKTTTFRYKLTRGINFIKAYTTFDTNLEQINTAQGLMKYSLNRITTIASFKNGKWDKIVEFKDGKIYGTDFTLNPGETYLILASEELSLSTTGYTINPTELDLSKLVGWNLVPTSIFKNKAEKAFNLFGNNHFDPIKQVALWNKDYSMFEYTVENRDGTVTGNDISLLKQDSIFIHIVK